jgi:hypothetical protein
MQRVLTDTERDIVEKLLSVDFQGVEALREQLKTCGAKLTGDTDNYGSIYLITESDRLSDVTQRVPVEAVTADSEGAEIDILLHVVDGKLNELEIVRLDGEPMVGGINLEQLKVILND